MEGYRQECEKCDECIGAFFTNSSKIYVGKEKKESFFLCAHKREGGRRKALGASSYIQMYLLDTKN